MSDAAATVAERRLQQKFRIRDIAAGLLLLAAIGLFDFWLGSIPNRGELGWRTARIEFARVVLDARGFAPLRLAGAWELSSGDPRFGGISALAVDEKRMVALSDAGAVIRFAQPGRQGPAEIGELPDGPGSGGFKHNRDSEALVRDPQGRGWWVAFEFRHQLWLYDPDFRRALQRVRLGEDRWPVNRGIESLAADAGGLLLFEEGGDELLRAGRSGLESITIANSRGRISDVVGLGAGRFIAIERRPTLRGFRNSMVMLEKTGARYRFGLRIALPLGPLDNVEAIAVEYLAQGQRRLWLMTDDNFRSPQRTLLIALDLPAELSVGERAVER